MEVSIHAPRVGERLADQNDKYIHTVVSIHAPRVGERQWVFDQRALGWLFQSTLPAWGSDARDIAHIAQRVEVSIHAPRVGERQLPAAEGRIQQSVSIHAPRVGERQVRAAAGRAVERFQSTLPAWGSDSSAATRP